MGLRITWGTWKNVDLGALSTTDEIWISGPGWGGDQECVVFSSSPGESLAHLKSEHCFMGMKSLMIGINCWTWFRKKICSRYGRCCGFLILFLLSLPDVTNSRQNHLNVASNFWVTSPQRSWQVPTGISFCTQFQGVDESLKIHSWISLDVPSISGTLHLMGLH